MAVVVSNDSKFATAKWIVSANISDGATHTTITSAMAAATSGDTIFLKPGTYTENFTMTSGVNLTAFTSDGTTRNVKVVGKITISASGRYTISNIDMETNSDFAISITGVPTLYIINCFLRGTNNTIFSFSSAGGTITIKDSYFDVLTTGVTYFTSTANGSLRFENTIFFNTGLSTTESTVSAGVFTANYCDFRLPIHFSGSSFFGIGYSNFDTNSTNVTALIIDTAGNSFNYNEMSTGTASCISITGGGGDCTINGCLLLSSNTNAIAGAGTMNAASNSLTGTSADISPSTSGHTFRYGIARSTNQPCFNAHVNNTVTNVTGDGTVYTIIFNTTQFDQHSDFNTGTGTFTAPVTGKYLFAVFVTNSGLGAGNTTGTVKLVVAGTSAASYQLADVNSANLRDAGNITTLSGSIVVPMTATDTANVTVAIGGISKVVGVSGGALAPVLTSFSGYLIC